MKKPLTISQAWAKIAKAFNEYRPDTWDNATAQCGLCYATYMLEAAGDITEEQRWAMRDQITQTLEEKARSEGAGTVRAVLWPYSATGAEHRTLLAGFFAEATKNGASL